MRAFVRSAALGSYAEVARRHGLDPHAMMRAAALDPDFVRTPDLRLPTELVVGLLEDSAARSGCDTFGLEMAESWRMSDFGAISLLLSHQRTLRDAITATIRYRHLLNDTVALSLEDEGTLVVVREELVGAAAARSRQAIELALGVVFRMFRALLGSQWNPRNVQFTHPAPSDLAVHRRIFGPRVLFGGEFNGIVCDAADVDRPNPSADPAMAGHAQRYVESLAGTDPEDVALEVRRAIYTLLPQGRAAIEQVARWLGTHPRALQRRLEPQSFSELLNGTRREIVVRYLDNPAFSLTRVAGLLGYRYPSSFTRWFTAEFGKSPERWRAERARAGARR